MFLSLCPACGARAMNRQRSRPPRGGRRSFKVGLQSAEPLWWHRPRLELSDGRAFATRPRSAGAYPFVVPPLSLSFRFTRARIDAVTTIRTLPSRYDLYSPDLMSSKVLVL